MHIYHSLQLEVIQPPLVRSNGYSEQHLQSSLDWFPLTTFYKSYTFKKNVKRTLHYILNGQQHFLQDVLSNTRNLLYHAEITSSNFKDLHSDLNNLKSHNDIKFDTYLTRLMHTTQQVVCSTRTMYCTMSIFYIELTMTQ